MHTKFWFKNHKSRDNFADGRATFWTRDSNGSEYKGNDLLCSNAVYLELHSVTAEMTTLFIKIVKKNDCEDMNWADSGYGSNG